MGVCALLAAYVSLRAHPGSDLLEALTNQALRNRNTFTLKYISKMLWAFAKLNHTPSPEFTSEFLDKLAPSDMENLSLWDTVQLMWAVMQLKANPSALFANGWESRITVLLTHEESHASSRKSELEFLVPSIWQAYGRLNRRPDDELILLMKRLVAPRLDYMRTYGLASVLWSLARLDIPVEDELYTELCSALARKVTRVVCACIVQCLDLW